MHFDPYFYSFETVYFFILHEYFPVFAVDDYFTEAEIFLVLFADDYLVFEFVFSFEISFYSFEQARHSLPLSLF